jgi:agmatinase
MSEMFKPPVNYGGLDKEFSEYAKARYVVLPVPYDLTTSYLSGTRRGPYAIIDASRNMELYDVELDMEPYLAGIHTLPEIEPVTTGPAHMVSRIEKIVDPLLADGKCVITLGGDHSIIAGVFKSLLKRASSLKRDSARYKSRPKGKEAKRISILQLDAHSDLRKEYEGSPFNHACVMRHAALKVPTVQVGIRSMSVEESVFIRNKKLPVFPAHLYDDSKIDEILEKLTDYVYVTIDLDVFDPSIMPGVGTPEPGGLMWRQVLALLESVASKKKILGFDVVELVPLPGQHMSEFAASKLVYKLIGYMERHNSFSRI